MHDQSELSQPKTDKVFFFVGAGPANLDLALRLVDSNPDALFVISDHRLNPEIDDFDRNNARSNVFLFDEVTVTGILSHIFNTEESQELWSKYTHKRNFRIEPEDNNQPVTLIQIRDWQHIALRTLRDQLNKRLILRLTKISINPPIFQEDKTELSVKITKQVMKILTSLNINEVTNLEIHVAPGAIKPGDQNTIIYPAKSTHPEFQPSHDLKSMPIVPLHAISMFNMNPNITCAQLDNNQISWRNASSWRKELVDWTLIRPPSTRVFYANGIVAVGAEIPVSYLKFDEKTQKERINQYMQTIVRLKYPNTDVLLNNSAECRSGMAFRTQRAERGVVQSIFNAFKQVNNTVHVNVMFRGDTRYSAVYHTAAGYVLASKQNQLYVQIMQCDTFDALIKLGQNDIPGIDFGLDGPNSLIKRKLISKDYEEIFLAYTKPYLEREDRPDHAFVKNKMEIITKFKNELYNTGSRMLIEMNKELVGIYFDKLHQQEYDGLVEKIKNDPEFNSAHPERYISDQFEKNDRLSLVSLLQSLVNAPCEDMSEEQLLLLKDAVLDDINNTPTMAIGFRN